jgi:hypothetical protein
MHGFAMGRGKELKGRVEEENERKEKKKNQVGKKEKRLKRHIRKLLKKQVS